MLNWIETHLVRAVLVVAALLFAAYELSAMVFAYSGDARTVAALVSVAPEVGGPISSIPVRADQQVLAGETVFAIDPRPFALAVASAEARLATAQQQSALAQQAVAEGSASLDQARARQADAADVLARQQRLVRDGDTPMQRVDDATRDAGVARAAVEQADAAAAVSRQLVLVRQAEAGEATAALDVARYELTRATVAAPAAGRVAPFTARPGDSAVVGRPVLLLVTDADWRIVANLTERHMGRLRPGQSVWVMLGSDPWRVHRGRVRSTAAAVTGAAMAGDEGVLPAVPADTDWIRLPQRFPVEIVLPDLPSGLRLYHGATARLLVWF
ncbi:MAG: secretion protein HlyD family protein [Rubritepida sp.]|nr:secretion protein HlyD family protein [Rubritepida sp.]